MVIGYTKAILWSDRLRHNIMTESAIQVFTLFFRCSEQKLSSFYVITKCAKNIITASSYKIFGKDSGVSTNFNHIYLSRISRFYEIFGIYCTHTTLTDFESYLNITIYMIVFGQATMLVK